MKLNHAAPIFVKVKFNSTGEKDRGHLKYISSRPGVERELLSPEAAHLEYAGTRPRSTGLFGIDPEQPPTLSQAQRDINERKRELSWRVIISLKEEDARAGGHVGRKAWENVTRRSMEHFAKAIGIDISQLRWVAAHHPEQGHPHVHVMVYLANNAPQRRGLLSAQELRDLRRGIAQVCFEPIRVQASRERTLARDAMILGVKSAVKDVASQERKVALAMQIDDPVGMQLPPKFRSENIEQLGQRLQTLADHMPGRGRAALKFMPSETKAEARNLADWLMTRPELAPVLNQYGDTTATLSKLYSSLEKKPEKKGEALTNAYDDLRDRVANVLVRAAGEINSSERRKAFERATHTNQVFRSVFQGIEKERLRAEAQAELASIEAMEKADEKARREQLGYAERY